MSTTPWFAQNLPSGPDGYGFIIDFDDEGDLSKFEVTVVDGNLTGLWDAVISDASTGEALFTNGAADDDSQEYQLKKEILSLNALSRTIWIFARAKISDATQEDFAFGLAARDTTFITATDNGLLFRKTDGSTNIDLEVRASGATSGSSAAAGTMTTAYREYAIRIVTDANTLGTGVTTFYIDGTPVGSAINTAALPTTEMALSFGFRNGEAVAKTLTMDSIGVWYPGAR